MKTCVVAPDSLQGIPRQQTNTGLKNDPGAIDGFTPEQRFFLSWAQVLRANLRPEDVKLQVNTDPHSPSKFRVLGPLSNMSKFAEAFTCEDGDPMVRPAAERADIW